jgi:hypothetical protein
MVAALERPRAVGRDEGERVHSRPRHGLRHDLRGLGGQAAEPALLPGANQPANVVVVLDPGTGRGERESAP